MTYDAQKNSQDSYNEAIRALREKNEGRNDTIRIVCAGRPQAWQRAGIGGKRHFTPTKTRNYQTYVKHEARIAMGERAPLDVPVTVDILAVFPIPKSWPKWRKQTAVHVATKPDADNIIKSALDAMNDIVYRDDALAVEVRMRKLYGEQPRLEIAVQPLPEAPRE